MFLLSKYHYYKDNIHIDTYLLDATPAQKRVICVKSRAQPFEHKIMTG